MFLAMVVDLYKYNKKKPHIPVRLLAPLTDERCNYNAMI